MNRRAFFTSLAAGLVLDPERLLWVPGKKLISIPKQRPEKLYNIGCISRHTLVLIDPELALRTKDGDTIQLPRADQFAIRNALLFIHPPLQPPPFIFTVRDG